ncbi:hypothetical protein BH11MYX2_BH11MYX2_03150 [soil metagenome]
MTNITLTISLLVGFAACKDDPAHVERTEPDAPPMPLIDAPPVMCTGGSADFLDRCTKDSSECGSCVCTEFHDGFRCTNTCSTDADCPWPSRGCGGDNLCREAPTV